MRHTLNHITIWVFENMIPKHRYPYLLKNSKYQNTKRICYNRGTKRRKWSDFAKKNLSINFKKFRSYVTGKRFILNITLLNICTKSCWKSAYSFIRMWAWNLCLEKYWIFNAFIYFPLTLHNRYSEPIKYIIRTKLWLWKEWYVWKSRCSQLLCVLLCGIDWSFIVK